MADGPSPEFFAARSARLSNVRGAPGRYFIGVWLDPSSPPPLQQLHAALVRTWGYGFQVVPDVVTTTRLGGDRLHRVLSSAIKRSAHDAAIASSSAKELAELAAELVAPLIRCVPPDAGGLRAIGLLDVGQWSVDAFGTRDFTPGCDTTLLAKITGLTVIDDFPARDIVHQGRGGPLESVGAWLLLGDRGLVPGRVIRGLLDMGTTTRFHLLPPRHPQQLPAHLMEFDLGPALNLLDGVVQHLTCGVRRFDAHEQLAVQGKKIDALLGRWDELPSEMLWDPRGNSADRLLNEFADMRADADWQEADILCSAIHAIVNRIITFIKYRLPPSQPIGQLVLAGRLRQHQFLQDQLTRRLPELHLERIDSFGITSEAWPAASAALLAALHIDQIPCNSYGLTGTDTPRVLGRVTPGAPGNWHAVLADMAATLPDKMTLRSAI